MLPSAAAALQTSVTWRSSGSWREGQHYHGDKYVDGGRVDVVDDAKGLLPFRVPLLCCCLYVTIAIAIVGLPSGCSCSGCAWREGHRGDKDVHGGPVNIVVDDKGLLKETNTR